jgi:phytoene synthase
MRADPEHHEPDLADEPLLGRFASGGGYAECRRLHRRYGTTYYFATGLFRRPIRRRVHALYGFVRVPDEWVDNPGTMTLARQRRLLTDYRSQFLRGLDGVRPDHPVLRAFCDVVRETSMPLDEPLAFLDAMEQDLVVSRYDTYEALRGYMRGSAAAVGVMMCHVLGANLRDGVREGACALGEAMQLTNFLRDVGEDARRGRIYLPLEDLRSYGLDPDDVLAERMSPEFVSLIRFEIARARGLYAMADTSIPLLPRTAQKPVRLARVLYSRILDCIEAQNYDVFSQRARTTRGQKLMSAGRVVFGLRA